VKAKDAAGNVDPTPAEYSWEIDLTDPVSTWTERPGRRMGYGDWVTNDATPTWAWSFSDKNLVKGDSQCVLYDTTTSAWEVVVSEQPCPSPFTLPYALADSEYIFRLYHYDKADNTGYADQYFEVDTVAPKFVSGRPTGESVSRYADVVVKFDDAIYSHHSAKFVNIYQKGSTTPLAVYRYFYNGDYHTIEIDPKNRLQRDTRYTVKVTTGVNDGANKLTTGKAWAFKTRG
jgi:hypothetical protein